MKTMKTLLIIFVGLFIFGVLYAEGPLAIKTRAWPTQVTLGDEIKLSIQVDRPKSFSIIPPSPKTPLGPFEIKNVKVSFYKEAGQSVRQTFLLELTVFQLGDLSIPPMPLNFTDPKGRLGQVWTDPVLVKVARVIKNPKEKTELRPIKGPVSLDTAVVRAVIFGSLAFLLAVWLIIKVMLRRKNNKFMDLESLKPPHERAMLELERLQAKSYIHDGKVKEFYSELADILRRYLERRFEVETLELTTLEIIKKLKEKEFSSDSIEKIRELLENSDLVKFAKFVPPRSLADRMINTLSEIVEKTKPAEKEVVG